MKNEKLEKMLIENGEGEGWKALDDGMKKVLNFYYRSKDEKNVSKMFIVDDIIWEKELEGFVKGLKDNGVNELVFASTWSSAIEVMMYFLENGYVVDSTVIYRDEVLFGQREIRKGIKMVLK